MTVGSSILVSDYNAIQSQIASVLGTQASAPYTGYGQTLQSSPINGVNITGSITSGTNVITTTSANTSMLNYSIIGTGISHGTIITGVVSGTSLTISTNASQTVTGGTFAVYDLKAPEGDISSTQWKALQNDIRRLFQHQLNAEPTPALTTASTSTFIKDSDVVAYSNMTSYLCSTSVSTHNGINYPGCYTLAPVGQYTTPADGPYYISSYRITRWGGTSAGTSTPPAVLAGYGLSNVGTISHIFSVTFPSAAAANYYFNSGGNIQMFGAADKSIVSGTNTPTTGNTINSKNVSWQTLLAVMGNIYFSYNGVTSSGSQGTVNASNGWATLNSNKGTSYPLFTNSLGASGTSLYAPNQYSLSAVLNSAGTTLTFTASFQDLSSQITKTAADPVTGLLDTLTFSIDQDADFTFHHHALLNYASGNFVSSTSYLPTLTTTQELYSNITSTTSASIATIPTNAQTLSKGQTIQFVVNTTGIADGTLNWSNIGTAPGTFFLNGVSSGTVSLAGGLAIISINLVSTTIPSTPTNAYIQLLISGKVSIVTPKIAIIPG